MGSKNFFLNYVLVKMLTNNFCFHFLRSRTLVNFHQILKVRIVLKSELSWLFKNVKNFNPRCLKSWEIAVCYCNCETPCTRHETNSELCGSSDTCQVASLGDFTGLSHPSDQDPSWRGPPPQKIEKSKCVSKWFFGKIQRFKPKFFCFVFYWKIPHFFLTLPKVVTGRFELGVWPCST